MIQGGQIPDVVEMPERWSALYVGKNQLESLEPWLAKWDETAQLTDRDDAVRPASSTDTAYIDPATASISGRCSTTRRCSQQAGIAEPPATMDDFMEESRRSPRSAAARPATACAAARAASAAGS